MNLDKNYFFLALLNSNVFSQDHLSIVVIGVIYEYIFYYNYFLKCLRYLLLFFYYLLFVYFLYFLVDTRL